MGIIHKSKLLVLVSEGQKYTIKRFQKIQRGWSYGDEYFEALAFSVSQSVKLIGVGIYCA